MNNTYKNNKTDWRRLGRGILLAALLLGASRPAMAQDYVFLYKSGNTVSFMTGTPTTNWQGNLTGYTLTGTTTFNPETCLFKKNGNQFNYLNGYSLNRNSNTLRFNATATDWTITTYGRAYNSNRYIRYNNGWTSMENNANPGTGVSHTVLFEYSNPDAVLSTPTITGDEVLTTTGAHNYSVAAKTKVQYYQFDGYSGTAETTYYWYNNALQTSAPNETVVTSGTWSLTGNTINATTYATVNTSNGTITVSSIPPSDLAMTLSCTVNGNGITKTVAKAVFFYLSTIATPTITRNGSNISLATTSKNTTIYYTTDGGDPGVSGIEYTGPFSIESLSFPVTIKAIAKRNGNSSSIATETFSQPECATPEISISSTGAVTISCATAGASIRYTTDGTDPSASSGNVYSGSFNVSNLATVKAIAYKDGYDNSGIASEQYITSAVSGGLVVLDDREDHTWTYYSDAACPVHRLNPADIKITYYGYGTKTMTSSNTDQLPANSAFDQNVANTAVQVNKGEAGHTFVYFKTLENANEDGSGNYPYTMISNPFQVRPTYSTGDGRWRGFYAWRVKSLSSGLSIKVGNTTYTSSNISNGIIIYAEQEVEFITANEYGDSVAFEALWAKAYLDNGTNYYSNSGNYRNAYERNFKKVTSLTTYDYPVTISSINPDGSGNVGSVTRGSNYTCSQDVKLENMTLSMANYYINGNSYNLAIGRGVANGNNNVASAVYGDYSGSGVRSNFTLRIEGGRYSNVRVFYNGSRANCADAFTGHAYFGSDYDRANNETNNKLVISSRVGLSQELAFTNATSSTEVIVMSGTFGTNTADVEFYMGYQNATSGTSQAKRSIRVYGGEFLGGLAGGIEGGELDANTVYLTMRISGGTIHRYLYGSGQYSPAYGSRRTIITGGTFDSWVSGGCYGTNNGEGNTEGNTYLYFGGRANQTNTEGIFGAGYGNYTTGDDKYTVYKSNVVFADEATTAGSVYGGGNNGYAKNDIQVYVAGGTVAGNVFGGANMARSEGKVAVVVTGGSVTGGVYGGSNQSGAISGQITVDVYGTDPQPGSGYAINQVFGGGNQAAYSGTPVVTVHDDNSCNISIGEVYGGGNQATVTGTNVTIEAGNIIGDVYGGGRQANVGNGGTSVTVNGGTIRRVFGGNNISGTIDGGTAGKIVVNVDKTSSCPMKIGQVFGGGNQAASQVGSITVGCTGDLVTPLASGQRYGYDQEGIGAVYGGANNAAITGNIALSIVSGIVDSVFGGNNDGGDIDGDITVNINKNGSAPCANHWYVGYVFGGGNNAEYSQKTANHPAVNVSAGLVTHHVFGGGNGEGATVYGNPTVTLSGTAQVGGNVYGGGNQASVTGNTSVKLQD